MASSFQMKEYTPQLRIAPSSIMILYDIYLVVVATVTPTSAICAAILIQSIEKLKNIAVGWTIQNS